MPLSRHFYSLDEVHAALTYSSRRNDTIETLFWCQELILSEHIAESISTLFEAWLWHKGPFHLSWLQHAWSSLRSDTLTSDDILLAASHLSTIPYQQQDHSLWNILALSSLYQGERVTPKTPPWISMDIDAEELYFIRALYQGKARSAWWMAQRWEDKRVWSVLESYSAHRYPTFLWDALRNYEHLLGYRSPEYDAIMRCVAVLSCCLSLEQYEKSRKELPSELTAIQKNALERWASCVGRKKRRIYTIPTACLYGVTERGRHSWYVPPLKTEGSILCLSDRGSHTNIRELNDIESGMIGCPFWEEAIAEYGTIEKRIQWNSDDDLEEFYDRYFPDDIPDEWTKAEKAVSHGGGLLGPSEVVTLFKYSRSTFTKWSRLAWNTQELVQKRLDQKRLENVKWDGTLSAIYMPCVKEYDKKILVPVHKRLRF